MRLLHTSDWHLGITFHGRSTADDQRHILDQICQIIKNEKIDAVLIAGDIFDRSVASADAIGIYDEIMTRLITELKVNVISIAGNHDGAERISQYHKLLEKSGLYLSGTLTDQFTTVEYDDVEIYLQPWFTPERAKAAFPDKADEINNAEDAVRVVCGKMEDRFAKGKKHILVSHAFIINAETSKSDRAAEVGTASAVSADVFSAFDYVALGHIHKPQVIRDKVRYCGSPMAYSFGTEENQKKGVVILDTEDMSQEFIELMPLYRRSTLRGTYDEIMNADYPEDVRTGYVRVEITDNFIGTDTYAMLSERYPLLLESKGQDPDNEDAEITMTIDEFEAKADNPEEIFRAFCQEIKQECTDDRLEFFRKAMSESEEDE